MKELVICTAEGKNVESVPEEIKLLPLGNVNSAHGAFLVTKESCDLIRSRFRNRKLDLVIDYEHQTLKDVQAPAAGWIKDISLGTDAVIAKVEWTERARNYLKNREYRYLSPVILARKSDNMVVGLHSAALTNTPAIDGMFALVNSLDIEELEDFQEGGEHNMNLKKVLALLGLPEDAAEVDVEAAIKKLQETAKPEKVPEELVANKTILTRLGLKEDAKTEDVLVAIAGLGPDEGLKAEIRALKAKMEQKESQEAVEKAMNAGKVSAAQKEWAMEYALKDPKGFATYVEKAPAIVPMGRLAGKDPEEKKMETDESVLAACKLLGISEEDLKKYGGND